MDETKTMRDTCSHCDNPIEPSQWTCKECEDSMAFNEIVAKAFRISPFSYNSQVTDEFFSVLEGVSEGLYNTDIAEKTGLSPAHVELIQYIICNNDHADYGTSPRGCWLTDSGREVYNKLKALRPN